MDPSTGTFISMDSYAGTLYDPVSLHKYLYANANTVMNTDPSGYTSLGELAAGEGAQISKIATEAFCNYVKVKALKGAIAGAVAGAVIGGIDSYLSGNDVTQIMLDALKGFLTGMGVGALISIALVYATFSAPVLIALKVFNYGMLVCGGYGVVLALDEGNGKLALFRGILALGGFIGFSILLSDLKFVPLTENESQSFYIPRDADGNPVPLKKQTINGQDIPLPDPAAEGRPHTVIGGKVSSETGEVYRQSATFPDGTWPSANGHDVPWSEVHWTDHGTPQFHTNPHEHIFVFDPDKGGWIRKGPTKYPIED